MCVRVYVCVVCMWVEYNVRCFLPMHHCNSVNVIVENDIYPTDYKSMRVITEHTFIKLYE